MTVNTYNATNDLLTRTEADNDTATRTVTKYGYDGAGHLTSVTVNCTSAGTTPPASGQGGTCTALGTQDATTNLITSYAYTANDQLAFEQDPLGRVTKVGYDTWGNQTSTTRNCTTSGTAAPSPFSSCTGAGTADVQTNVTSSAAFDQATTAGKAGMATTATDALGRATTFSYDALGRQLTEVSPGDSSIPALTRTTTYDELGNTLTDVQSWTGVSRTTSQVYDLANRTTATTDPAGVTTTTGFDLVGNATSTTSGGVTTTRTFDGLGRTLTETTAGDTTTHAFDAQGNEIRTLSAEGDETMRTFTRTGWLLTETVDPLGANLVTTRTYDRLGREVTTTDPAGLTMTLTYDLAGRQVTSQVSGGPLVTTVYDRAGNAVAIKGADGTVTASLVDPLDRVVTSIANCTDTGTTVPAAGATCAGTGTADAVTNITTRTYYDAAGTPIAAKDPKDITTRTIVNVRGLARDILANCTDTGTTPTTNPPACVGAGTANPTTNVKTTITYDGSGAALLTIVAVGTGAAASTETAYDAAGRAQAVKDPRGTISRSFYDPSGRLTRTVVNCTTSGTTIPTDWINCTGAGTADGTFNLTTTYGYDTSGNQTSSVAPNGRETRTTYDADGRVETRADNYVDGIAGTTDDLVTTTYYDAAGRQAAIKTPVANGTTFSVTRYLYDTDGRLQKEIRNCTDSGTTPPVNPGACAGTGTADAATNLVTEYGYDARGNRTRLIAPDPSATTGTASATVTTQSAYDGADRLCRVVENATGATNLQALANPCADATQTAGTTTANVSTRYTYDAAGNLATMIDAKGATTTYGYDAAGRMTSLTDPLGGALVWTYDALGNKVSQRNRTDPLLTVSVAWTYDGAGRILTRTADGVTTTYTYDATGNKLTATTGGQAISTTYDRLGRPLTIDDEDAGTVADTTYAYSLTSPAWSDPSGSYTATLDRFDRATAVNDPVNATDFAWTYRADGQPGAFAQPNGNTTILAYDPIGRLVSKDTGSLALYDWTYNRAGQVLTEASTISGDPANGTVTYAYDPLERLTGATLAGQSTVTYGWAAVPNRTSVQVGAGTPATTTYDAADRPTTGANPPATYTSDADGRLTAAPSYQYAWDDLGRLTTVTDGAGTTLATYTYDPLDRLRLVDYGGGNRIRFRYTGLTTAVAAWLDDATGTVTRSVANGWTGERLADWTGAGANQRIYGTNAHHDTTWLATSTGSVSQALRYDQGSRVHLDPAYGAVMALLRSRRAWSSALVAVLLLGSCAQPGFRIMVRTENPNVELVRVSAGDGFAGFVYESPPGVVGSARQGTGEFDGTIEFLTSDCKIVATTDVNSVGDVLVVVGPDGSVSTSEVDPETAPILLVETDRCVES